MPHRSVDDEAGFQPLSQNLFAISLFVVLGLMASCGYAAAGQWDDDPKNWERAFNRPLPKGWEVIRSRYARYPHFTHESEHWFHIRVPGGQKPFEGPDLIRSGDDADPTKFPGCPSRPDWFPESPTKDIVVWRSSHYSRFLLARHSNGRDVYLRDCQL